MYCMSAIGHSHAPATGYSLRGSQHNRRSTRRSREAKGCGCGWLVEVPIRICISKLPWIWLRLTLLREYHWKSGKYPKSQKQHDSGTGMRCLNEKTIYIYWEKWHRLCRIQPFHPYRIFVLSLDEYGTALRRCWAHDQSPSSPSSVRTDSAARVLELWLNFSLSLGSGSQLHAEY